ncbi:hypothetical protein AN191_17055 [Loktanella sp. 5RATIMAR09]|nr:hypothetical protein AN191_17055 [Loktanella sp. 5RATIMAR09]
MTDEEGGKRPVRLRHLFRRNRRYLPFVIATELKAMRSKRTVAGCKTWARAANLQTFVIYEGSTGWAGQK